MVSERNAPLRCEISCLEYKLERNCQAFPEIEAAIKSSQWPQEVRDEGVGPGPSDTTLSLVQDILKAQDRLVQACARLDVLMQRLDGV